MKMWLASFPRSGNTYFRNILYYCYGIESSAFHNGEHYPVDPQFQKYDVVKTHLLPHELPKVNCPVVYLIRDGRDSLVSMAHQKKDLIDVQSTLYSNLQEAIVAAEGTFFGGWSENVKQWMEKADVVIRYEDLVADPIGQVERLRKFIDMPEGDITKLPTFEQMKKGEAYFGLKELDEFKLNSKTEQTAKFFRKGKSGSWRDEMPTHLQDLFWNYHGETMERLGYTYTGDKKEMDDLYDSSWKQKINPYTLPNTVPSRVLVEADKILLPSRDGVKRYVVELLAAIKDLTNDVKHQWTVDVQVMDKIYTINSYLVHTFDRDLQPPKEHFTYEEVLLFIRRVIKALTPSPVYNTLAPIYRKKIRKSVLSYRNTVVLSQLEDDVQLATPGVDEKNNTNTRYHLMHIPLPQNYRHANSRADKFVFTVHDLSHKLFPQLHKDENVKLAEEGMQFIENNQSGVISISNATQVDLKNLYPSIRGTAKVVPEAVDRTKFKYNVNKHYADMIRTKYNIPCGDFFLTVSTIEPRKNIETLLSAFNNLCEQLPDRNFSLVVVGSKGWKYDSVFKHKSRFSDRIIFAGHALDTELAALYSEATAFCYLSLYEGFGLPVLEAMSCRCPVIVANNSSLPELVADAGVLVETKNVEATVAVMKQMLLDKDFREQKAVQAWRRSFQFSWRKTAIDTLKAYNAILEP